MPSGMNETDSFRSLEVWQLSMQLVEAIYAMSERLPRTEFDLRQLGAPSPSPRQVFAIGLNYQQHATEAGLKGAMPDLVIPPTFTKYAVMISR